ncbi:maleylpyruvate isomerase family mycothiol-dependent enzyme [Brevibacterium linens]|uniref:TIGR03083 family protein n=1 Tax=Brevibacterium linens ATCC 9172 TaxID=1255617 RepID=A0A2H1HQT7_BRELN|nr:maleylpyruvate isomerase family mycothiol-dependent enzyme [Brevibacterium linens]KAB1949815.1 maleylpyruvate isomerase family mycothiol-dependent enzyme [Brevibacterium linens ATCC 9172]SMX65303.1 TIGR03083 family protein [Brevibacterium linens ATCC 9172]
MNETEYWDLIHTERARLADLLSTLEPEQWALATLCADWTVEQVVAHLGVAANTGRWAWIRSIVRAGFDPAKHNARLLERSLGGSPEETLAKFHSSISLTIAPTKDFPAFLGEVIVHGQDIARPLELDLIPDAEATVEVARYFASKDFAVNSKTLVKGVRLSAVDADFESGSGPQVAGRLLDLVMAMAGRPEALADLTGSGVAELRRRMD